MGLFLLFIVGVTLCPSTLLSCLLHVSTWYIVAHPLTTSCLYYHYGNLVLLCIDC